MMIATTRPNPSVSEPTLFVAFEVSKQTWKLALTAGMGVAPWVTSVPSGDEAAVRRVVEQARRRFGLPGLARVVSCYEAGRDGFWIHRALTALGFANRVVDSASIEVSRRARRAKTDRLDALKLVAMLVRVWCGERRVWREVRVPTLADEAARHVSRERTALVQEQTRLVNQMRGWLATWGATLPARRGPGWWTTVRDYAEAALPGPVQARLARADARLTLLGEQLAALETQQRAALSSAPAAAQCLVQLKGVATTSVSVLLDEGLDVACVSESAAAGRDLGVCPDAVRQWRGDARARDQSRRQCPPAVDDDSARLELGAVATREPDHAVVSCALWARQTGAQDWHCRGRTQAADCAVAVCDRRPRPGGRAAEGITARRSAIARHARRVYGLWRVARAAPPAQRGYRGRRVRIETAQSLGATPRACVRIEVGAGSATHATSEPA